MKYRMVLDMKQCMWSILLLLLLFAPPAIAADGQALVAGHPPEEALRLGEAMFLQGVLPSGKPMKAVVRGGFEMTGKMVACSSCHRRSGMGTLEEEVVMPPPALGMSIDPNADADAMAMRFTPPISGAKLYAPTRGAEDIPGSAMKHLMLSMSQTLVRPAYTDQSLANALLRGIGPTGRKLRDAMPRYLLDEDATKIMVFYLKNLSSRFSAGATREEIRFATIVADGVSPGDKDAMLLPLKAFIREEWNERNARLSAYNKKLAGRKSYPKASLDVWELKGPPGTWGSQLEEYYRQNPVFAILGGITTGKWAPVHEFCEKNSIPCIFPITDLPLVSGTDWYTLYFSKGFYQEGETAAKYLARIVKLPPVKRIVQVFRDNDEGSALARGFEDTWKKIGTSSITNKTVAASEKIGVNFWKDLAAANPGAVMLVWLGPADLVGIEALAEQGKKQSMLFVSATMLAGTLTVIPDKVRDFTFITYPTRLPGDEVYTRSIVTNWMKMKKIPLTNVEISAKVFLFTRLLSSVLLDMGEDYYRDFFLDVIDESVNEAKNSATYPMLSLGTGQRYVAKGCYVVKLSKGEKPKVARQSDWIIY